MQFPITLGLHRSAFLGGGLVVTHGVAIIVVALVPWEPWVKAALISGLVITGLLSRRWLDPGVQALRLLGDGRIEIQAPGGKSFAAATLTPNATVHPWLTVFGVERDGERATVVVAPDSLSAEDFRRLRLWLRWRANFTGVSDDA